MLLENVVRTAEALRHVLAGELEVPAAGPDADLPARREEPFELVHDRVEATCLDAAGGPNAVAVHRVGRPEHGMAFLSDRAQERRQHLADMAGAHARVE